MKLKEKICVSCNKKYKGRDTSKDHFPIQQCRKCESKELGKVTEFLSD